MRIGYFGDGPWAHQALELIIKHERLKVDFICARFEYPDPVLKSFAASTKIPFLIHRNINSSEFLGELKKFNCDIFVSMSFDQIFKKTIILMPPRGTINCHAGKLPFYRGRNVLNWALINNEKEFGITVHYIDEGIDTGDIILQKTFPISDGDDYSTLLKRAHNGCAVTLLSALQQIEEGTANRTPQASIHPFGSYCVKRVEGDERINWNQSSRSLFNFIRALCPPGPAARTQLRGQELKIYKAEYFPEAVVYMGIPGSVLDAGPKGIMVKTRDTYLRILKIEPSIKFRIGDRLL